MMMGTPGEAALKEPKERPKFIEDMTVSEMNVAVSCIYRNRHSSYQRASETYFYAFIFPLLACWSVGIFNYVIRIHFAFRDIINFTRFISKHAIPVGLQNLGNTCYMNATLQCKSFHSNKTFFTSLGLARIPELNDSLDK
jgi:hypothetical protein